MSVQTEAARAEFDVAMADAQNLVDIHRDLNLSRGRRFREMTINRAIVVLTVSAWQAYVQDLAKAIVDTVRPATGQPGHGLFVLVKAATDSAVARFNTPNVTNTRNVLVNIGFDPRPLWTWGRGQSRSAPADVAIRVDEWLRVRHAIAHGSDLPEVSVLSRTPSGVPTLQLRNAEACMALFTRTTHAMADGAHAQFP
jgi:hypothetical protein